MSHFFARKGLSQDQNLDWFILCILRDAIEGFEVSVEAIKEDSVVIRQRMKTLCKPNDIPELIDFYMLREKRKRGRPPKSALPLRRPE